MLFTRVLAAAAFTLSAFPATLSISTYLKDGFTPTAIASDLQGNIILAGSASIDAASRTTGALVAKLDPKASQYLYLAYLDSAASDQIGGLAIDAVGNAYVVGTTSNPRFPVAPAQAMLWGDYLYKIDVTLPSSHTPCGFNTGLRTENLFSVTLSYNGIPVGPLTVPVSGFNLAAQPMPMTVWVSE